MTTYSVRRIVFESYPVLLACAIIGLFAGYMLNAQIEKIKGAPIILLMIPPINGIGGNIGSILGARLASALHMGTAEPKFKGQKVLSGNISASVFMSVGIFSFVSLSIFAIAYMLGMVFVSSIRFMLTFLIASMMLVPVIVFATIASAFISFTKGFDPDNVVIPIVTSIVDLLGVTCLLIAVKIVGV